MDPSPPSSSSMKTTKTTLSPLLNNPTSTTAPPTTTPTPTHPSAAKSAAAATAPRDPITCHVLDTTTGLPAARLTVSLTLLRPLGPSAPFTAQTDADGRVSRWNQPDGPSLQEIFENMQVHHDDDGDEGEGRTVWELRFGTGEYYGEGRTFWPEVRVGFFVEGGGGGGGDGGGGGGGGGRRRHYHVPLLLGPWGYTTYRGS